jgi:phosphoglycolate/pyridoxal phosphate phosphatase family enzyme
VTASGLVCKYGSVEVKAALSLLPHFHTQSLPYSYTPVFPKSMLYVFDMDGVLFRMDDPLPGASEAVHRLMNRGDTVYYLTNNSSKSRADYVRKLARFDIPADEDHVMTSAYATAQFFIESGAVGKSVYVVGEQGLRDELSAVGMNVVDYTDDARIDYVVSGWDRQFTYAKLAEAHLATGRGATFIATNRDATYPDSGGRTLPGSGAIVASIETCTGVVPKTIGKPEPYSLELILRLAGTGPEECMVIGDRLDTDIGIGKRVGTKTALVLTGVTTRAELETAPPELLPDFVFETLHELK